MAYDSSIEWTEATWNPVTGCTKVSIGCKNCYAERLARRLQAMGNPNYRNGFKVTLHEQMLDVPLHWRRPRMVFVNSMSDLFHPEVPVAFIKRVFDVMRACHWHKFQVLTKRGRKMKAFARHIEHWPANVWMGVTVENGRFVNRIRDLQEVPSPVRFLSCEPLIGPTLHLPLDGIHWVIVGGESGPGARPMKEEWVRSIQEQCRMADVPFFFKQWGGVRKHLAGRVLDGRTYDHMPRQPRQILAADSSRS